MVNPIADKITGATLLETGNFMQKTLVLSHILLLTKLSLVQSTQLTTHFISIKHMKWL